MLFIKHFWDDFKLAWGIAKRARRADTLAHICTSHTGPCPRHRLGLANCPFNENMNCEVTMKQWYKQLKKMGA